MKDSCHSVAHIHDSCDLEKVSQICICKKCESRKEPYNLYQNQILKKFRLLNSSA